MWWKEFHSVARKATLRASDLIFGECLMVLAQQFVP
jgi:hypothetical protein